MTKVIWSKYFEVYSGRKESGEREGHGVMTKVIWSKFSMVCVFDGLVKVKCGTTTAQIRGGLTLDTSSY